ncbi:MAG: hypothetical protein HY394_06015 [Candidatus Diapherotrites archaeon]|nr:hypothetical protein [Candidatus Diapherotrites archaeon]
MVLDKQELALEITKIYYYNLASKGAKESINAENILDTYNYALLLLNEKLQERKETAKAATELKLPAAPQVSESGFSYTNQKGITYYLHQKGRLFYFSKDSRSSIVVPQGYRIKENPRTGLPFITKK